MTSDRRAFSVASLAERWTCSTSLVRKLIRNGQLQSFQYGKLIRITADEVDRYEGNPLPAANEQVEQKAERAPSPMPSPERTTVRVESRGWPEAMRRKTAAAYCDVSEAAFEREVFSGRLPQPFKLGGRDHWRKAAIDSALDFLTGGAVDPEPEYRREFRERYGGTERK